MRLIIVEDEGRLLTTLRQRFEREGFAVDSLKDLTEAQEALANFFYDAAIIDLGLPDGDGLTLIETLRQRGQRTPVLVLTARDAIDDRVAGLDSGADDYLVKPFAMAELVARVKALLRRPGGALGTVLTVGNLSLDTVARQATVSDHRLEMSRQQIAVLEQLIRRVGQVVPKTVLEDKLYGLDQEPESNPIPVHIHNLRKCLEAAGATVHIHTVRGVGYLLLESGLKQP